MDSFYLYVSIAALVILILILTVIGVSLTNLQSLDSFPPTRNACPDYWDVSSNPAYCGVPVNSNKKNQGYIQFASESVGVDPSSKQNIGMCTGTGSGFGCSGSTKSATYLELSDSPSSGYQYMKLNNNSKWGTMYPGITERCAQKNWAQTLNLSWDGVSNYNGC
jgi:hypothetical protein